MSRTKYTPYGKKYMMIIYISETHGHSRLCFGIPRTGGRIVETGIEKFLKMETRGTSITDIQEAKSF